MDWMNIARYFYLTDERLQQISRDFADDMERALQGKPGATVSALKSYVSLPGGEERGVYLALDFGGTNVMAARIRLLGRHCYLIEKKICQPLRMAGQYDYLSSSTTAGELFDFLARLVGQVAHGHQAYTLGHTFSFALERQDLRDGRLLSWSKEIAVPGVEGQFINKLLKQALVRQGLTNIEPAALVNDTTALLLSAVYTLERVRMGLVCGTGFNACYYEPAWDMIVNLEAGDYGGLIRNRWDKAVDARSAQPGWHRMEKMVSGAYVAEIFQQTLLSYFKTRQIPDFSTAAMNDIISCDNDKQCRLKMGQLWKRIVRPDEVHPVRNIGAAIFVRAAQLAGAVSCGILRHLYGDGTVPPQSVAVDGSLLEHVRGALFMMEDAMQACQNEGVSRDKQLYAAPVLIKDGPLVGAAVAAAMAVEKR